MKSTDNSNNIWLYLAKQKLITQTHYIYPVCLGYENSIKTVTILRRFERLTQHISCWKKYFVLFINVDRWPYGRCSTFRFIHRWHATNAHVPPLTPPDRQLLNFKQTRAKRYDSWRENFILSVSLRSVVDGFN